MSGSPTPNLPNPVTPPIAQVSDPFAAANLPALPARKEVVAVGDNHGCDPVLLKDDLAAAGVVDAAGKFNPAYPGVIVQIGDTVDRGRYSMEIFEYWRELQKQAPDQVVRLLGNHELYHLMGVPGLIRAGAIPGLQDALIDDIKSGKIAAAWAEGDVLYIHAGLDLDLYPEYMGKPLDFIVKDLNKRLVEAVDKIDRADPYANIDLLRNDALFSAGPAGNGYGGGIFWARQPIENTQFRQVVGHTPQKDGIKADPGLRVKYIDANRMRSERSPGEEGENARELMFNTEFDHSRRAKP